MAKLTNFGEQMQDKQNKWRLRSINVAAYTSIALIYHLMFLTHAFQYGSLAGLISWDDCGYIVTGLRNVEGLLTSPNPLHFILSGGLQFHCPLADVQILMFSFIISLECDVQKWVIVFNPPPPPYFWC